MCTRVAVVNRKIIIIDNLTMLYVNNQSDTKYGDPHMSIVEVEIRRYLDQCSIKDVYNTVLFRIAMEYITRLCKRFFIDTTLISVILE